MLPFRNRHSRSSSPTMRAKLLCRKERPITDRADGTSYDAYCPGPRECSQSLDRQRCQPPPNFLLLNGHDLWPQIPFARTTSDAGSAVVSRRHLHSLTPLHARVLSFFFFLVFMSFRRPFVLGAIAIATCPPPREPCEGITALSVFES